MQRRQLVLATPAATALGLAGTWVPAAAADAPGWNRNAFAAKSLADVLRALGAPGSAESREIAFLQAPEIAETGSSVRFEVVSRLPGTTQLALVVEKNPFALAALFDIPAGTEAQVTTHLKMQESSNVFAVAKAGDRWFHASKNVTVTLGGCAS